MRKYTNKYIKIFAVNNYEYYKNAFRNISKGKLIVLNWAGIFNIAFLFYRKMYLGLFITYIYLIVIGVILNEYISYDISDRDKFLYLILYPFLSVSLWLPIIGNYIYFKKYNRCLNKTADFSNEEEVLEYFEKVGGVSIKIY